MEEVYDSILDGDLDAPERFVGKKRKVKVQASEGLDKKEVKKTPEIKISEHLKKLEIYYSELKLTDPEKEARRKRHIDWVREKLSNESIEINPDKEIIIKKVDGGIGDGPTGFNAINPGSGIVHRFVVPRDYENANQSRATVVREAIKYLNLWKRVSQDFKIQHQF